MDCQREINNLSFLRKLPKLRVLELGEIQLSTLEGTERILDMEGFKTECPGVQYLENKEADYAVITITDPFVQAFERIPNAYKLIMEYLKANNFRENPQDNIISCFEHVYEKDEVTYMDVYVHVDGVTKADTYSQFN